MQMQNIRYALILILGLPVMLMAAERMNNSQLMMVLKKMDSENLWGEMVLKENQVRSFKVESITQDTIAVLEVFGSLQQRPQQYLLEQIYAVRELGENRIALQQPVFSRPKSMPLALTLGLVPGLGHAYLGQPGKGSIMLGIMGTAIATAWLTGKDGAAAWVPLGSWFYLASLWDIRDEVQAINASAEPGWSIDIKPGYTLAGRLSYRF